MPLFGIGGGCSIDLVAFFSFCETTWAIWLERFQTYSRVLSWSSKLSTRTWKYRFNVIKLYLKMKDDSIMVAISLLFKRKSTETKEWIEGQFLKKFVGTLLSYIFGLCSWQMRLHHGGVHSKMIHKWLPDRETCNEYDKKLM